MNQFQNQGIVSRIIAALVTIVIIAAAIFLGAFLLVIFLGLAAVVTLVLAGRVWWVRRKMAKSGQVPGGSSYSKPSARKPQAGRIIEGEVDVKNDPHQDKR